ncbi:LEA type 2 family protein [Chitinibacter fontanus]|uniref:LEA type 2 family protein n=1 Tax=Chitinibacter fontanus TaxID=1737446 RepID=A0A7D5V817_9NEIS|nr:LEA type 2 family protein [Chitinibacter fontanus]QLI80451.1 LEA type 2 family protein [Chitinibacter fontanus]
MRMIRYIALLVTAAVLIACNAIPNHFEKPQVSLASISLAKFGLLEQQFVLNLRVTNPNDYEIPVNGLHVNVDINNQPFAQGVSNEKVTLPRLGEKMVKMNVTTNLNQVLKQLKALQSGDMKLAYKIYGKVYAPLVPAGLAFERKGELEGLGDLSGKIADKL